MQVRFVPLYPAEQLDRDALIAFIASNVFPFHGAARSTAEEVVQRIDDGAYGGDGCVSLWIDVDGERVGCVTLDDIADPGVLFNIRLAEEHRGRGFAVAILTALTRHVFDTYPAVIRFEGQTRVDNIPMRRTFVRAGWVKEAYYRHAWPGEGGEMFASVGYAVTRPDWESGTSTPVDWNDGL